MYIRFYLFSVLTLVVFFAALPHIFLKWVDIPPFLASSR